MPPIDNNEDYAEWYHKLRLDVSEPFTTLLGQYVDAHNELKTLTEEAQRRGQIRNNELYPAIMKRDVAGAALHDWLGLKVQQAIQTEIAKAFPEN